MVGFGSIMFRIAFRSTVCVFIILDAPSSVIFPLFLSVSKWGHAQTFSFWKHSSCQLKKKEKKQKRFFFLFLKKNLDFFFDNYYV